MLYVEVPGHVGVQSLTFHSWTLFLDLSNDQSDELSLVDSGMSARVTELPVG